MSLKSGCFQDLSIGGLQVALISHADLEELKKRCYYSAMGIGKTETWEDTDESKDPWIELWKAQHAKFLDRRFE